MAQTFGSFHIRKTRKTAEVLKEALWFIIEHAGVLFRAVLFLCIPFILVSTFAAYTVTQNSNPFNHILTYKSSLDKNPLIIYSLAFIVYAIGAGLYNLLINKYLVMADAENKNTGAATFDALKTNLTDEFKSSAANFAVFFIIYNIILQAYYYFLGNGAGHLNPADFYETDPFNYYSEMMLSYLPLIVVAPLSAYFIFSALFVCFRDKTDTTGALKKVWLHSKTNIGKVWVTSTSVFIVYLVLMYLLNKLLFILFFGVGFFISNLNMAYINIIYMAVKLIFTCIALLFMQTGSILLFGSLEDEEEGHYIKSKIDEI